MEAWNISIPDGRGMLRQKLCSRIARSLHQLQKERSRYDMLYHLIHGIILNHTGKDIENEGSQYVQAVARPIVPSQTPPYSILDLGCGTGIWASDMAR